MDDRQKDADINRVFNVLLAIGMGAFFLVLYLYLLRFWTAGFSPDPARWAEFGEYLGGTLSGVFGLLAFIGILITISQQQAQLNLMRSQFGRDELLRLAATAWKAADDVLNKERLSVPAQLLQRLRREGGGQITVHHMLAAAGRAALQPRGDYLIDGHNAELLTQIRSAMGLDADVINLELDHLAECLLAYRAAGGSPNIEGIYHRRAGAYAAWLDAAGFPCSDRVKSYFGTDVRKESLTPAMVAPAVT
jgi:hypothetical protein